MNVIQTLFIKLGGVRKVAEKLKAPVTTVQYWYDEGRVPSRRQSAVIGMLDRENIEYSIYDIVGITPPKGKKKRSS